jgi:hypothetical protein
VLAVVRDADPRRLDVWTTCTVSHPVARVVGSDARRVRIGVSGEPAGTAGPSCSTAPTRVPLELAASLGDRAVYADGVRRPVPVLSADELPAPSYLPTGYRADGVQPVAPGDGRLVGERDYRNGTDRIVVMVGSDTQVLLYRRPPGEHVTVGGRDAVITNHGGTCITWQVRASVDEAVCVIGNPDANLPTSEVVKIARSLP